MGLLIKIYNGQWQIRIREKWQFKEIKDLQEVSKMFLEHKVAFTVDAKTIPLVIDLQDVELNCGTKEKMFTILNQLVEYKDKYGRDVNEPETKGSRPR